MKKFLVLFIILFPLFSTAHAGPIHKSEENIPISDSIMLTKVKEFYSDKNISYSYIKADLTDENTSLKLLKSNSGTDILETVESLAATNSNTVAAMNADFFSVYSGKKGFALGIEIKDGELNQSPINPDTMATISYADNSVMMSYLDFHIMAVAPNGQYEAIRHLNKHTSYYGDILMYTSDFNGGYSPAPGGVVVEVVVEDNKIVEFRRNMPSVKIPENGCVLVVSEGSTMFLANNFNVGDEIKFDYYITPDLSNAETAFGGGAMILVNGQCPSSFSHVISGYNPRSAIGIDQSGTTLYLVAVNGRQDGSKGMTMYELSDLMRSIGCYNAVNLDGGGSTNMLASTVWYEKMHTVNSPTENRRVINAVALTYDLPAGEPHGIMLEADKPAVFIGQPVKITSAIHDINKRPVTGNITWSSDYGHVENGVFTPHTGGKAVIYATCQNATGSLEIFVVDKISGIETDSHLHLNPGELSELKIHVYDNDGHYVEVSNAAPFEITSSDSTVVSVSGKTLTAHKNGSAVITVKKDGAVNHISVTVGSSSKQFIDNFESLSGNFIGYPNYVTGSFSLSSQYAYSGINSGKITYDFTADTEDSKGAYFNLTKKHQLYDLCKEISVYFYSENEFNHELRAQFKDGNGKIDIVSFGKTYQTGKWQRLTAKIPADAVLPLSLDRIYVLYTPGEIKDSGSVFIDDLSFDISDTMNYPATNANVYEQDTTYFNYSSTFAIGKISSSSQTYLSKHMNDRMRYFTSFANTHMLLGEITSYTPFEDAYALYIPLNTSKGGIRKTYSKQWDTMANAISSTTKQNVFIISEHSIFGDSSYENEVLQDYLASLNKNVFVITPGNKNTYKNIGGVNYFTIGSEEKETLSATHLNSYQYLEFYFGENISYQWRGFF